MKILKYYKGKNTIKKLKYLIKKCLNYKLQLRLRT